jgi:hypothetical protein
MKRVFSKETYNGYHIVGWSGDPSPVGFFKKLKEKDEYGFLADDTDQAKCPNRGQVNTMGRPWGEFIIVPSLCQKCPWVYQTPDNEFNCLLLTKDKKIRPSALVKGGP